MYAHMSTSASRGAQLHREERHGRVSSGRAGEGEDAERVLSPVDNPTECPPGPESAYKVVPGQKTRRLEAQVPGKGRGRRTG